MSEPGHRLRVRTIRKGGKWVGVVYRTKVPEQVITQDESAGENVWCSKPCDKREEAEQLAEAERQRGDKTP